MKWQKTIIDRWNDKEVARYEWTNVGYEGFIIDVSQMMSHHQGKLGSNQVTIFMPKYGGFILGTPRNFRTIKEVTAFVSYAKKQIEQGKYGKRVPWAR